MEGRKIPKGVQPVSLFSVRFLVAALSRAVVAAAVWGGCEGGLSVTAVVERTIFAVPSNLRRNSRLQRSSVTDSDGFGFAITLPWTLKTSEHGPECGNEVVPQPA